jgi:hypothetical protein
MLLFCLIFVSLPKGRHNFRSNLQLPDFVKVGRVVPTDGEISTHYLALKGTFVAAIFERKCSSGNLGASRLLSESVTHACKTGGPRVTCGPFEFS